MGILGMGRIASGFDRFDGPEVQTHMKAIMREPRLKIAYVADVAPERACCEAQRFKLEARVVSPEEMLGATMDVLCIASPDGTHLNYLTSLKGRARLILTEKPLEGTKAERAEALANLEARGSALVVHHQRRWIPQLNEWMFAAKAGAYGRAASATVHYTRGLRHNGVHALDLIAGFVGTDVRDVCAIGQGIADLNPRDLTRSLLLTLGDGNAELPVMLYGVDGRIQTAFAVDIRFEKARVVVYDEGGIRAELHRAADIGVEGFAPELRRAVLFHDDPPALMTAVWRNIADHLERGTALACVGRDALAAYDLADAIEARLAA